MEPIIDDMVDRYESGTLSRRALVQGLTALAAMAASAPAAKAAEAGSKAGAAAGAGPIEATNVDHVSILTKDLQGSIDFYKRVFGFNALSADKDHKIMRMGPGKKIILSLRQQEPYGKIDHFGFRVPNLRANIKSTTAFLKDQGVEPKTDWEFGYHFLDPNGAVVQLV